MTRPVAGPQHSAFARMVLRVLQVYREAISPLRPACCRYSPTCSAYAVQAIEVHGLPRGSWLAARRLLRCHPFHRGGFDPVPARTTDHVSAAADAPTTAGRAVDSVPA